MSNYDNLLAETEYDSDETSLFNTMSQLNQCKDWYLGRKDLPVPLQKEKQKRCPKGVVFYIDENGDTKVLPPTMSTWYLIYVQCPAVEKKRFQVQFRNRFRLPYEHYKELVQDCKQCELFDRWECTNTDAAGNEVTPIELLILASLRYLGRGWTFDDLSESTAISSEVIRKFSMNSSNTEVLSYSIVMLFLPQQLTMLLTITMNLQWLVYLVQLEVWMPLT